MSTSLLEGGYASKELPFLKGLLLVVERQISQLGFSQKSDRSLQKQIDCYSCPHYGAVISWRLL